ncbi:MAG: hypothetical protein NTY38_04100 [Acidobacteria bacterium]|nr:hypothetical protein [Acidobacteriota bacterium]
MLERFGKILLGIAVVALLTGTLVGLQAPQKNWKPGEYELYQAAAGATDLNAKVKKLDDWRDKFKESDYADIRQQLYLDTYQKLNKPDDALRVGGEILSQNPKDIRTTFIVASTALGLPSPSADSAAVGEKAAHVLADNPDSLKPEKVSDADWAKTKPDLQALGHTVLGKLAMLRKDYDPAEKAFTQSLQINPKNAQVSYWLGMVDRAQKSVDKQSAALFHFARAASYDGTGALNDQGRKEMLAYLEKAYLGFHGDKSGLPELLAQAKTEALPPAGFKIETAQEIAVRKEEEFRKTNPMLALWMSIRKELTAPEGVTYFDEHMKGASLPGGAGGVQKFKGKVVSQKPAVGAKEVVLGVADATTPEVTLKLDAPLPGKAPVGTEVEFEGVASAFAKDPFMVTFDVEKAKVTGWPAPAPPVRRAPARKGAGKKR